VRIGGAEQVGHEVRETAVVALRGPAHAGDDLVVVSGQDAAVAGGDLAADDAGAGLAFALVVGRAEAVDLEEGEELAFVAAKVLGEAAVLRLVDLPGEKLPGLAAELIDERGTVLSLEVGHDLLGTAGLEQQPLDREREARRAALLDLEEVVASAQEMGVALLLLPGELEIRRPAIEADGAPVVEAEDLDRHVAAAGEADREEREAELRKGEDVEPRLPPGPQRASPAVLPCGSVSALHSRAFC